MNYMTGFVCNESVLIQEEQVFSYHYYCQTHKRIQITISFMNFSWLINHLSLSLLLNEAGMQLNVEHLRPNYVLIYDSQCFLHQMFMIHDSARHFDGNFL